MTTALLRLMALVVSAALLIGVYLAGEHAATSKAEAAQVKAIAKARADDIERLQQAQAQGDALTAKLQTTEATLHQKQLELKHALALKTTGRPCLSGDAVRLLNNPSAYVADLPTPATGPAAADGATATDADVADWAANAREQYDTCRARLDALIDWHQSAPAH